ncbi:MAG TPA: hypothetical protein VNT51_02245, partial [Miltoncostaeaceae bacterium]|nr:hypothetical protein [Miltoncostaeaceae bacterium]
MLRRPRPLAVVAVTVVAAGAVVVGLRTTDDRADAARSLLIGLQDDRLAHPHVDPGPRLDRIRGLNAEVVRVDLRWDLVATRRPEQPRNPGDAAYDWSHYDRVVDAARTRRMRLMLAVWGTPGWAADPSVPPSAFPAFSTRPRRPADAGDFAAAVARRYGPRGVHMYEAWNEPNIPLFLRPQYRRAGGRWVPESPRTYSRILTAMYRGFHSGNRRAIVGGGVTAPAGDRDAQGCTLQPDCRIPPRAFVRALGGRGLRPPMDVYSHHPYP